MRAEQGQSVVEFALVLPLLLLVVVGIFKFGVAFNHYLTLTDAVRSGARQLALERGQGAGNPVFPCTDTRDRVLAAAGSLDPSQVTITIQVNYLPDPYVTPPGSGTCAALSASNPATVSASYPCELTILGIDFFPSCHLTASATERVE